MVSHKRKAEVGQRKPVIDTVTANKIDTEKKVRTQFNNPISYDSLQPAWSFKRMLHETKWVFPPDEFVCHDESSCIDPKCVFSKLAAFESMTWREIKQQTYGGKNKTNHHFITDLSKLDKDAQQRLEKLQINENFFSLRLEGAVRVYGLLQSQVFEVLWYDNKHEIYPVEY